MSDDVKIRFKENGPIIVTGEVSVVGADGAEVKEIENVALCRCGHSENKPFCDGSHVASGFKAEEGLGHSRSQGA
jgi:CDGSH-type Zn-finger protein